MPMIRKPDKYLVLFFALTGFLPVNAAAGISGGELRVDTTDSIPAPSANRSSF